MKTLLLLSLLAAAPDAGVARPPALPRLSATPKVDGSLGDWSRAGAWRSKLETIDHGPPTTSLTLQGGWSRDTLYLGLDIVDPQAAAGDELTVTLTSPEVGPLATGHQFRLSRDGLRRSGETPAFAQSLARAAARKGPQGFSLELAIPARAFPRFGATGPIQLELCTAYADQDAPGGPVQELGTCPAGPRGTHRITLPPAFRTALGLRPPKSVTALEPAPTGWLGYSDAPHPVWVQADSPLTRDSLQTLFAPDLDPQSASLKAPLPPWVTLSDGRRLLLVLSGRSPFREEGACSPGTEARLGLFLVDKSGRAATRVLDWSAANCELGRVLSVALDDENALEVGYSGGAQVRFVWVGDHFERTDIG